MIVQRINIVMMWGIGVLENGVVKVDAQIGLKIVVLNQKVMGIQLIKIQIIVQPNLIVVEPVRFFFRTLIKDSTSIFFRFGNFLHRFFLWSFFFELRHQFKMFLSWDHLFVFFSWVFFLKTFKHTLQKYLEL